MAAVNDIDVLSACFIKGVCCKLTYHFGCHGAWILVVMDYWSPNCGVDTKL